MKFISGKIIFTKIVVHFIEALFISVSGIIRFKMICRFMHISLV